MWCAVAALGTLSARKTKSERGVGDDGSSSDAAGGAVGKDCVHLCDHGEGYNQSPVTYKENEI